MAFDYIIIGAGSAGCVLANKLGADTSKSVLVLEAGPMDRDIMIHVPVGVYRAWQDPKLNWNYNTAPQENLEGRSIFMPRGKVVGGSSSINSMVYMRGHPMDYDGWATNHGLTDWRYADCLPYFKAGETYADGGDLFRGDQGPLGTVKGNYDNPIYDAFIEAGDQAGQGRSDDLNGAQPEGVARLDATKRHGRRCSAAVAHLRPALKRGNVTLLTRAMVQQIVINGGRAVAVRYIYKGQEHRAEGAEIILSGGAINSPQTLMLSGIGPADHLAQHEIKTVVDLPGVGQNLQDHANVIMEFESLRQFPIHRINHPIRKAMAAARWVFFRDGIAASNIWEAGGLIRGNEDVAYPNLQYHLGPVGFEYTDNKIALSQAFAIHIDQLRPSSMGQLRLTSANPDEKPRLDFNYFADPQDLQELVEGVKKTRELVAQSAFDQLRGTEISPGPQVSTDADIAAWLLSASETDFHPCGTCRMGHGADAVVNEQFQVIGVDGLRVVDASIMPSIVSGNLNGPTQMIAARAADMIMGRPNLAPITPEPKYPLD